MKTKILQGFYIEVICNDEKAHDKIAKSRIPSRAAAF